MSHVAGVCSGRRSCELQVDSLRAENCQRDFPFYLNASYSCVKGMRRHLAAAAADTPLQILLWYARAYPEGMQEGVQWV